MNRRLRLALVGVIACTSVVLSAPTAVGQVDGCPKAIEKQTEKGVEAGGGPKEGVPAPTNCDHFFQFTGDIGNEIPPGLEEDD
jgi:hypothetical protein